MARLLLLGEHTISSRLQCEKFFLTRKEQRTGNANPSGYTPR